ncbi:hypothetical protein [Alteromonas halophila]|uniref:DUF3015 domain-containing protein n=1 Tax=Alteromonas halophila TaxID=516698 RepID=A0A918N074_9ALTE|nr:hypothetical protein [Alteromonas halophila]GGW92248.1 hypothetical protein GCM10007391_28220 [Alteromonas halophila]
MRLSLRLLLAASIVLASTSATAGIYTNDLSKCLVSSTNKEDRVALVKWMFTAASAHPAVSEIASITDQQIEIANQQVGDLFMRLLTESCLTQTKEAVTYEGMFAIQQGFQVLGQVAGQEMFASPEVAAGMAILQKYIDNDRIEAAVSDK